MPPSSLAQRDSSSAVGFALAPLGHDAAPAVVYLEDEAERKDWPQKSREDLVRIVEEPRRDLRGLLRIQRSKFLRRQFR